MIKAKTNIRSGFYKYPKKPVACFDWYDWFVVHEGRVRIWWNSEDYSELLTGQSVLIFPGTSFRVETAVKFSIASANHFTMDKSCKCGGKFLNAIYNQRNDNHIFSHLLTDQMFEDLERILALAADKKSAEIVSKRMELILIELARLEDQALPTQESHEFESLRQWLADNVHRMITLGEMAEYMNMSTSLFRKLFHKNYGTGPGKYFLNIRMQHAAKQLTQTSQPIKNIAKNLGYAELPHFYRAFKKVFNLTPRKYRLKNTSIF